DAANPNSLHKITADPGSYNCLSWTPEGRILYTESEEGRSDVWTMNTDGTARQRLTDNRSHNNWPAISADRRYLVFSSNRIGNRQIWRSDGDGRNPLQLTGSADPCYQPRITADGQWVIYLARTSSLSGWVVRKVPIDGGGTVLLAERVDEFAVSPDG